MARFTRIQVFQKMAEQGLVPLFYHADAALGKKVLTACYQGGARLLEFTNRGDFAHEVFGELNQFCARELPEMILGVGSVTDAGTASLYLQLGANFVVTPVLREDIALVCNRRKILWSPGCGSLTEICRAEELGCEIVKLFPGGTYGPSFVKDIKGPQPWTSIMPTGGVSPDEENLRAWFDAGVTCVGMGSQLISSDILKNGDMEALQKKVAAALALIKKNSQAMKRVYLKEARAARVFILTAIFAFCVELSCTEITDNKTLKLAHGLDTSHPVHKGMERMAGLVKEKSDGKLKIEIYPSQQLGTERQCLELLQIGSLAMTKVSGAVMESFAPNFQVLSLPYIFRDMDHAHHFFDSETGKKLLVQGEKYWLRGLTYFDAGQRSFYTKDRPVRTPADLKGLKIRVQESVMAMNLVRAMDAAPTPISYGEIYTALQQGIVDGAENNPPSFHTSRHYEICKYYTLNEHTAVPDILVIGTVAWNRLTQQEQNWIQSAADEATVYQRKLWQEAEQHALEEVKKAGVEVIVPDKKLFAEKTKGMFEAYRDQREMYELIHEIRAVQ